MTCWRTVRKPFFRFCNAWTHQVQSCGAAPLPGLSCLVSEQYDLSSPHLMETTRKQLESQQTCILRGFLTPNAVKDMVSFATETRKTLPHPGITHSTVYYQKPDNRYDKMHPLNREVTRSNTYITARDIPVSMPLRQLQENPSFLKFLQSVTAETLNPYQCQVSKFVFSLSGEGDHQDWHFDNNYLTLTFMLQKPTLGGLLEVYPDIGRTNYKAISAILDGESQTFQDVPMSTYEYEVGDMILFTGRTALHRSTQVSGSVERIIAIISYNTPDCSFMPDATHMEKVYGMSELQTLGGAHALQQPEMFSHPNSA